MGRIKNVGLAVKTDRPGDRANILVSCDLEFTDFEVNSMNMLGLQCTLDCRILNKHLLGEIPVVTFRQRVFPRPPKRASRYAHAAFEKFVPMGEMNEHVFGKDSLVAEVTLRNEATGVADVRRSEAVAVYLVA